MPGGKGNIRGTDGNTFSSTNQPKRRRGKSIHNRIKALLDTDSEAFDRALKALLKKAEQGDLKALEFFADRTDGKPKQSIDVSNPDGSLSTPIRKWVTPTDEEE